MQHEGSIHQLVCQAGGTAWLVEANKKIDEEIRRGREIRSKCLYTPMCDNPPKRCAEYYPDCQSEWRHFVNNND